jgi:hypothetical protein
MIQTEEPDHIRIFTADIEKPPVSGSFPGIIKGFSLRPCVIGYGSPD